MNTVACGRGRKTKTYSNHIALCKSYCKYANHEYCCSWSRKERQQHIPIILHCANHLIRLHCANHLASMQISLHWANRLASMQGQIISQNSAIHWKKSNAIVLVILLNWANHLAKFCDSLEPPVGAANEAAFCRNAVLLAKNCPQ